MLKLKGIKKDYLSGSDKVEALKGVSVSFRKNEFVSILGPSGCGKTTLLNIIGGLDQYTSGDLVIRGKSTKDFHDSDWDAYRNHSIGFVFQSYNLIPHQSVLSNVELALTLSGVSKTERRKRAISALEKVGLKDQIKKRPNQLSGGQMQRVAIARALVNDPEILLADEPTGALDTVTSIQIMEILKEISREKLVIMVTHNPELAEEYSTRIIKLLDGKVTHDSSPYDGNLSYEKKESEKKDKKPSMSLFTALSLSTNNLMTKKGRTILTSFAGSIGIIGIALILSLSNGINAYINSVQEETLSSYPITIQAESVDMSALMTTLMGIRQEEEKNRHDLDAVYSSSIMHEMVNSLNNAQVQTNNLTLFKEFLDSDEEIKKYISNILYSYDLNMNIFTKDANGKIIKSDMEEMMAAVFDGMGFGSDSASNMTSSSAAESFGFGSISLWQEMLPGENGKGISPLMEEQYDLLYGSWPKSYKDVVLVVDKNNELSDVVLCGLGLKTTDEIVSEMKASQKGEELDTTKKVWSYEEICKKEFKVFLPSELYQENASGNYTLLTDTENGIDFLYRGEKGVDLKISGIIRVKEDVNSNLMSGALGYSPDLTAHLLEKIQKNDLIQKQNDNPTKDVILGLPFLPENYTEPETNQKAADFVEYIKNLSAEKAAEIYIEIASTPTKEYLETTIESQIGNLNRQEIEALVMKNLSEGEKEETDTSFITDYISQMSDEELFNNVKSAMEKAISEQYAAEVKKNMSAVPQQQLAMMLTTSLSLPADQGGYSQDRLAEFYDLYMPPSYSENTLEQNLKLLGLVKKESPNSINIYTDTFENKDMIADLISEYNKKQTEEDKIEYTDIAAMMMSGIATIINAISYVLIAFVSISLIVSSIMIGIITYISVLERIKEIGILRAIGASKKDISRVFNAESIIEGFAAGIIGIGITLLLIIPINIIIRHLTEIPTLGAALPPSGYLLILISVLLSFIAGLVPAKIAAKKDPVEALRTE